MNKIILVHYVNVSKLSDNEIPEYFNNLVEHYKKYMDDSILQYWIPILNGDSRIECLNPKLVTEQEFTNAYEYLNKAQAGFMDFINLYIK